ncbi:MAG: hypothetical protein NT074_03875 [Methanomicrobiales archaeon]|nr:hypothetical protein [Methanomicrobiales archaeon]
MTGYAPYSTSAVVNGGQTIQVVANLTLPKTPTTPPTTTPTKSPVSIMLVIIAMGGIVVFFTARKG